MVGGGKNMLPSVCIRPEPLAARWLLLVLLSPLAREVCIYPATFITLYQEPVHVLYSHSPYKERQKVVNPINEGKCVLSGNVKIWMICLSWACVCGIRAIFFCVFCSFAVQQFFVSLDRFWCYTMAAKQGSFPQSLLYWCHVFSPVTTYSFQCLVW